MVIVLAVPVPHLSLFLVADVSRFSAYPRWVGNRVSDIVANLVNSIFDDFLCQHKYYDRDSLLLVMKK